MRVREIKEFEINKLLECLSTLSEHHNQVSSNFKGFYPSRPHEETLNTFSANMKEGISRIAVAEDSEKIVGFCKKSIQNEISSAWISNLESAKFNAR